MTQASRASITAVHSVEYSGNCSVILRHRSLRSAYWSNLYVCVYQCASSSWLWPLFSSPLSLLTKRLEARHEIVQLSQIDCGQIRRSSGGAVEVVIVRDVLLDDLAREVLGSRVTFTLFRAFLCLGDEPSIRPAKGGFHSLGADENVGVVAGFESHFSHAHEAGVEPQDVELPVVRIFGSRSPCRVLPGVPSLKVRRVSSRPA